MPFTQSLSVCCLSGYFQVRKPAENACSTCLMLKVVCQLCSTLRPICVRGHRQCKHLMWQDNLIGIAKFVNACVNMMRWWKARRKGSSI